MTMTRLGDVVDVAAGQAAPPSDAFSSTGIPFVRAGSVDGLMLTGNWNRLEKLDERAAKAHKMKLFPDNTVVFAKSGMSAALARVFKTDRPAYIVSHLAALKPNGKADPNFLTRWLEHYGTEKLIKDPAYPSIRLSDIEEMPFPKLDLLEQGRIAGILDQADALRRKRNQALDRLSDLGQAIFYEMFGDPISNPMGWDQVRLANLCEVGSSKRVFASEFLDDGIPFYRGTEIGKLGAGESIQPTLFISQNHYESLVHHSGKPSVGDILLPSICHDGRIWTVDHDQPFYFKDGRVLWIKCSNSPFNGDYLRSQLRNMLLHNYNAIASGSNFAELKIINLKNLTLLNPPLQLQKRFAELIQMVGERKRGYEAAAKQADSLFASLQHRAFRGEL